MKTTALTSIFAAALLIARFGTAAQMDATNVAENIVVIEGRLKHEQVYGPPGFGETPRLDSKFTVYYVELKQSMSSQQLKLPPSSAHSSTKAYSQVQLYCGDAFANCEKFIRKHVNQIVLVSGDVAYALEPNDVYPITLTVRAIDTK